mmetsp:Transcript_31304/g.52585  ORF Transcript_31304/g.52585 Transcript_31304/m.52585 type:complete len:479 (+) Transcript_31304:501-1937(+)|eukprot:CAMPEP_0198199426 /NCGR_PEP_ID=MMETSP1445-20131203/2727_1 /TAXON_ID=36898 /ORGANISM="Pyramimonas sp., Strain CCMP2087" /LENGTH=478 /DNA_ID=CAMNT_0043869265 /DNA_START=340 /DNA_END=1776 /DNA_ORIENTATION=-
MTASPSVPERIRGRLITSPRGRSEKRSYSGSPEHSRRSKKDSRKSKKTESPKRQKSSKSDRRDRHPSSQPGSSRGEYSKTLKKREEFDDTRNFMSTYFTPISSSETRPLSSTQSGALGSSETPVNSSFLGNDGYLRNDVLGAGHRVPSASAAGNAVPPTGLAAGNRTRISCVLYDHCQVVAASTDPSAEVEERDCELFLLRKDTPYEDLIKSCRESFHPAVNFNLVLHVTYISRVDVCLKPFSITTIRNERTWKDVLTTIFEPDELVGVPLQYYSTDELSIKVTAEPPRKKNGLKAGAVYGNKGYTARAASIVKAQLQAAVGYKDIRMSGGQIHSAKGVWTDACTEIMKENPRLLLQFDRLRQGAKMVQGHADYAVNPLKLQCMIDGCNHSHLMSSQFCNPSQLIRHYVSAAHKDDPKGKVLADRWAMWVADKLTVTQGSLALAFPFLPGDEEDRSWIRVAPQKAPADYFTRPILPIA